MYTMSIIIVWYMFSKMLLDIHQQARRKASRNDKIAAITVYGIIAITAFAMLMLTIGGAHNG